MKTLTISGRSLSTNWIPELPVILTYLAIWSLSPVFILSLHESAFFNSLSQITVPNYTWELNSTRELSFKTCFASGKLLAISTPSSSSQTSASTSVSPLTSQELVLLLRNSSVIFTWNISGQFGQAEVWLNVLNSRCYTVRVGSTASSLQLRVSQGATAWIAEVANRTFNSFLLNSSLTGDLRIGEGFKGCLYQGLGVNFSDPSSVVQNITWDTCPLSQNYVCTLGNQTSGDCYTLVCQNGTSCLDTVNNQSCLCPVNGTSCSGSTAAVRVCGAPACFTNGNCQLTPTASVRFNCFCSQGFSGSNCTEDIDECLNSSACGGFVCSNHPGGFTCECPPGFDAASCQVLNSCLSSFSQNSGNCMCDTMPCGTNETCLPVGSGYVCVNSTGPCQTNPCHNNGVCYNQTGGSKCMCQAGWTGELCQDTDQCLSNPCQHGGTCHPGVKTHNCTCPVEYEGNSCEYRVNECSRLPCQNGGTCFLGEKGYTCNCTRGFMGKNCTEVYNICVERKPCQNGGSCSSSLNSDNYTCTCPVGFSGQNCEHDLDDCLGHNCSTYKQCKDGVNNFTCVCPQGYSGDQCDQQINLCQQNPCPNGTTCQGGIGNYTCLCEPQWINLTSLLGEKGLFLTGYNSSDNCRDINECLHYENPPICQAHGICINTAGSFACYCPADNNNFFTGRFCELNRSYCSVQLPADMCQNGGTCRDIVDGYRCDCPPGFTGNKCEVDINECASSPCQYNGNCTDQINGYKCTCIDGISGKNCEININDCEPNPCFNSGQCQDRINSPRFLCNCTDTGFNGTLCQDNINDCAAQPCHSGGTCQDGIKNYTCHCFPGYTGKDCEVDVPDCTPNPCQHGSQCLEYSNTSLYDQGNPAFTNFTYENATGYLCICVPGLTGKNCSEDIDECQSSPCQHNSTCQNIFQFGFNCNCSRGYEGKFCETEINECNVFRPCQNGGSCVDLIADYNCICTATLPKKQNYAGRNCSTYLKGCDGPRRCINGDCIPILVNESQNLHSFRCECFPGYSGRLCSETTDVSFRAGHSDYIQSSVKSSQLDLHFRFRTTLPSVILLLWKMSSTDFLSVEIIQGKILINLRENGTNQPCSMNTLSAVNNSAYHPLHVKISSNVTITLPLDSCWPSTCHTQGCQAVLNFRKAGPSNVSQVYIGSGTDAAGFQDQPLASNFVGCLDDITFNGVLLYPGKSVIGQYFGVSPGCTRTPQCDPDSCSGHGYCEDLWESHACQCYRPYYDIRCQLEYQAATFGLLNEASVTFSQTWPGSIDNWTLSFFIVTRQYDGFILFFGLNEFINSKKQAFVGLYLNGSKLSVDFFKCGFHSHFDGLGFVSDGQRHFLSLEILARTFKVRLDSSYIYQDNNVSASAGLCAPSYGFLVSLVNIGQGINSMIRRRRRDVSIVGLAPSSQWEADPHSRWKRQTSGSDLPNKYKIMPGFQGVIQDVQLNENKLSFNDSNNGIWDVPYIQTNITIGAVSTVDICQNQSDLCQNGGTCRSVFYNDYECDCSRGFMGVNCSLVDYCFVGSQSCPAESECRNLPVGYECVSTAWFREDSSVVSYALTGDLPNLLLTFDFKTRGLFGLIFILRKGDNFLKVRVASGKLQVNWKLSEDFSVSLETRFNRRVDDGQWYHASLAFINDTSFKLEVSQNVTLVDETDIVNLGGYNFSAHEMWRSGEILLGNTNRPKYSVSWEAGYKGCLREVRLGGQLLHFYTNDSFSNNTAPNSFLAQHVEKIVGNCQGDDVCSSHSCLNGGSCLDLWNDYKCECPAGLEGSLCEINPDNCLASQCLNGGLCVDGLGSFTCTCPKGFYGDECQQPVDWCQPDQNLCSDNSTCESRGYDYTCNCTDPAFTGWFCNITTRQNCSLGLCQNGGSCSSVNITLGSENVSSFHCHCGSEFEGPLCEKEIDYCSREGRAVCANNGTCQNDPGNKTYRCDCSSALGYTGENCSQPIDYCSNVTCNNGLCLPAINGSGCLCSQNFTGPKCDIIAADVCLDKSLCQHGVCSSSSCNCTGSGWKGDACNEELNECNSTVLAFCLHDGNCSNLEGSFSCNCTMGFEGARCETPNCTGLCQNGGNCITNSTNWWCSCPRYIEGDTCEKVGRCYYQPCNQTNTVSCFQSIENDNYTCQCRPGWTGYNCSEDVNECENKTICNNGTCSNTGGSYTCSCQPGYTGRNCESDINECDSSPCQHGGQCTNLVANFSCNCDRTGYEGATCSEDVNECAVTPTLCNNGSCLNQEGSYTCNCSDQYLGSHCSFSNPCYNNSQCGPHGDCHYNQSQDGGGYLSSCVCSAGFQGANCQQSPSMSDKSQDLGIIIGPIVGGVVLIILIIVVIAFIMAARSKRATRGTYSPSSQETSGSRVEFGNTLKKPPEERLI